MLRIMTSATTTVAPERSLGGIIPSRRIKEMAAEVARTFLPSRIILFGSYATGTPRPDSDVDLLVLFRGKPARDMTLWIRRRIQRGFALDVIVMDEERLAKRLSLGDFFLMDVVESGKVLYESAHA